MLSKVYSDESILEGAYTRYIPPSNEEITEIIENNKKTAERKEFIEENKDDPVAAAQKKADEILRIAQEKYKKMEIEAETLKIKMSQDLTQKLTGEFEVKLNTAVQQISQNFQRSLTDLSSLKQVIFEQSEQKILELVFQISRRVIDGEVRTNPDIVIDMLKKGFERVREAENFEIRINPADFELLSKNQERLDDIVKSGAEIKFVKSDNVERGGCIIKTPMGEVITEPSKLLENIKKDIVGDS